MRHLETPDDGTLGYRILRAIGRCRAVEPTLPLDNAVLGRCLERTLGDTFYLLDRRLTLERGAVDDPTRATPVHDLLVDLLRHRFTIATERLFRLVGLLYPAEDARTLYRGVHDPSPKLRDSSRELLGHLLEPPLRSAILALVDDISDGARLARAHPYYVGPEFDYVGTLSDLLKRGDAGTVGLVAHLAGTIGANALVPQLEQLRTSSNVTIVAAVEQALAKLTPPEVAAIGP